MPERDEPVAREHRRHVVLEQHGRIEDRGLALDRLARDPRLRRRDEHQEPAARRRGAEEPLLPSDHDDRPTSAANRLSPVIDSNWFWIANRSAIRHRMREPERVQRDRRDQQGDARHDEPLPPRAEREHERDEREQVHPVAPLERVGPVVRELECPPACRRVHLALIVGSDARRARAIAAFVASASPARHARPSSANASRTGRAAGHSAIWCQRSVGGLRRDQHQVVDAEQEQYAASPRRP
jgi:hypothetical protein